MYKLLRNILFLFDAEKTHSFSMNFFKAVLKIPFVKEICNNQFSPKKPLHAIINHQLERNIFGLAFKNPVGLAAGFDKNAKYLNELEAFGFGFIEIGTVTPLPQKGNDKPRLFRLPKDRALINRMGFNNAGVDVIAKRLKKWKEKQLTINNGQKATDKRQRLIIGGNIGKNKITSNENAWKDYETCFRELFDHVDYFVVNVSSPNTPGLRELQQKNSLKKILGPLQNINHQKPQPKPLLLKISPDMNAEEMDDLVDLAIELKLSGIVVANTTISRQNLKTVKSKINKIGPGGLSGRPLNKTSTCSIKYICNKANNTIPVIASGGIFNSEDALEKINAGAVLVQVWTGFIYEGPAIVKNICYGLTYLRQ